VRQYFARGNGAGISNIDGTAQNDAARHKTVETVIVISVVFLRIHFDRECS
jgi:hypothetical protein